MKGIDSVTFEDVKQSLLSDGMIVEVVMEDGSKGIALTEIGKAYVESHLRASDASKFIPTA